MPLNWNATKEEHEIITSLADRAMRLVPIDGRTRMDWHMDIEAVHCNGCPLKLRELLKADDFNAGHDLSGIARHLNRETGELEDCFLPRFASTPPHHLNREDEAMKTTRTHLGTRGAATATCCGAGFDEADPIHGTFVPWPMIGSCTCPDCLLAIGREREAAFFRRAELDQELKDLGGHVIQVKDLGAALEARRRGGVAIETATAPHLRYFRPPYSGDEATTAAHLARQALGEVGS